MYASTLLLPLTMFLGFAAAGINSVSYEGSGCPLGTVSGLLSSDGLGRTFIFQDYRAYASDGPSKGCKITISYSVPSGWTSSSLSLDFRGYAQVAAGAKAVLTSPGGGFTVNGQSAADYTHSETITVNGAGGSTQSVVLDTVFALSESLEERDAVYLDSLDIYFRQRS